MSVNKSEELILTVYTYFENSIFVREKDDSVKEHFVRDSKGYFGAFIAKGKVDDQLKYIESKVKDKTLSDVVGVVIYQMFMNKIELLEVVADKTGLTQKEIENLTSMNVISMEVVAKSAYVPEEED